MEELVFTIVLIVGGIAGFIYSINLPAMGPIPLSPGLFPSVVTGLIIILSGFHLHSLLRRGKGGESSSVKEEQRSLLILILIFAGYLVLLYYIHFILSTIVFLLVTMIYLYKRFYWKIPIISVSTVFVIYLLFKYLLRVRLP